MAINNAYTKMRRVNKGSALDQSALASSQGNNYSGGHKVMSVGPEFMKQQGNTYCSGRDVSGGGSVYPGSILWLYNNDSVVHWVALGTAAPAAPTGFTNGIPLPPNSWSPLAAGENSFIQTDSNKVGLYEVKDDTQLIQEP